jgi:hypothetical protein
MRRRPAERVVTTTVRAAELDAVESVDRIRNDFDDPEIINGEIVDDNIDAATLANANTHRARSNSIAIPSFRPPNCATHRRASRTRIV